MDKQTESAFLDVLPKLEPDCLQKMLHNAIEKSNSDLVKILIQDSRLDLDKPDLMELATEKNNAEIIKMLTDHQTLALVSVHEQIRTKLLNDYQTLDYDSALTNQDVKLYDFYDDLNYTKPLCMTYPVRSDNQYNKRHPILRREDWVKGDFHTKTNNVFNKMDWQNVIVAGGFIFGLLNSQCNDIFKSTDIDLFVWGKNMDVVKSKCVYLLEYFKEFNPFYIIKKSLMHIMIPGLKHMIQIVPFISETPVGVINDFDFNYTSMYYDGTDVRTTLRGLIALKYQLAMYKHSKSRNFDLRIYKTIRKGLKIKYDPKFKSLSSIVTDNYIDIRSIEADKNIDLEFGKYAYVRKSLDKIESSKHIDLIKLVYDTDQVTKTIPNIDYIKMGYFGNYVNDTKLHDKFIINECGKDLLNKITLRLTKHSTHPNLTFYSHLVDNHAISMYAKLGFKSYKIYKEYGTVRIWFDEETKSYLDTYSKAIAPKLGADSITMYDDRGYVNIRLNDTDKFNFRTNPVVYMILFRINHEYRIKYLLN